MEGEISILLSSVPDEDTGARIARELLDAKLAACVNIIPKIRSIYRWKGEVRDDAEVLLIIKTQHDRVEDTIRAVKSLHPYDVPEIISIPIEAGWPDYMKWIIDETTTPKQSGSQQ